jgi:hypothetical protein
MTSSNEQSLPQETITNTATNSRKDSRQHTFTDHASKHEDENVERSNTDNSSPSTSIVQEYEPSRNRRSNSSHLSNKVAETVKVMFCWQCFCGYNT